MKYDKWKNTKQSGYIFLADLRSKGQEINFIQNKEGNTTYIEFSGNLTFNGQRMTYPDIPFLLQNPQDNTPRCSQNPANRTGENVIEMAWAEVEPHLWAEIILINNGR